MLIKFNTFAALIASAAFMYPLFGIAQAPIVDASTDSYNAVPANSNQATNTSGMATGPVDNSTSQSQGEMFYQLQLLQQEVMQLRGIVEEQSHLLKQLKDQSMERYIDLDRRLGELTLNRPISNTTNTAAPVDQRQLTSAQNVVALKGEKSRYDISYNLVVSKRFDEALESFKQFLVDFPDGKYAPNSLYWLGELYQVINPQDLEASRQAFTQLLDQYPMHAKASDAMYKLGKVYFQKGNKEKSRQWMERVISDYGQGVNAAADKARQFLNTKL